MCSVPVMFSVVPCVQFVCSIQYAVRCFKWCCCCSLWNLCAFINLAENTFLFVFCTFCGSLGILVGVWYLGCRCCVWYLVVQVFLLFPVYRCGFLNGA